MFLSVWDRGLPGMSVSIKAGERKGILERVTLERRGRLGPVSEKLVGGGAVTPRPI